MIISYQVTISEFSPHPFFQGIPDDSSSTSGHSGPVAALAPLPADPFLPAFDHQLSQDPLFSSQSSAGSSGAGAFFRPLHTGSQSGAGNGGGEQYNGKIYNKKPRFSMASDDYRPGIPIFAHLKPLFRFSIPKILNYWLFLNY